VKRRFFHQATSLEEATINLTPLIDVVFVVLILFILITPMLEFERIELATANHVQYQQPERGELIIRVEANDVVWYRGREVTLNQLEKELSELFSFGQISVPQLIQDQRASFGAYQRVKNVIEKVGFEQLDVRVKSRP